MDKGACYLQGLRHYMGKRVKVHKRFTKSLIRYSKCHARMRYHSKKFVRCKCDSTEITKVLSLPVLYLAMSTNALIKMKNCFANAELDVCKKQNIIFYLALSVILSHTMITRVDVRRLDIVPDLRNSFFL